jgi:hypothetical protein
LITLFYKPFRRTCAVLEPRSVEEPVAGRKPPPTARLTIESLAANQVATIPPDAGSRPAKPNTRIRPGLVVLIIQLGYRHAVIQFTTLPKLQAGQENLLLR